MVCCTSLVVIAETIPEDPREQTKSRLMYQIKYEGWDPYSADMTVEEFYALMELFEEGKLPLDNNNSNSKAPSKLLPGWLADLFYDAPGVEEPATDDSSSLTIPREKFLFSGIAAGYNGDNPPLEYDNANYYEPYDPDTNERYTVDEDDSTKFILNNKEYILNVEDGRLYNETAMENYTPIAGLFTENGIEYFAWGYDGNLYEFDGTEHTLSDGANVKSLSGTDYIWRESDNKFYKAVTNEEYNESGEYYYNKTQRQAYEWRNGAMCIAGIGTAVDSEVIKRVAYYYPAGLDTEGMGYMRPSAEWEGIKLNDKNQAVIIKEEENTGEVGGYADQSLFLQLDGYYVKNVTINGIAAKILGMIKVSEGEGANKVERYVYYYMSSDQQDTQVSTTMLPDAQKFVVEYVPIEHTIEYKVELATQNTDGTYSYVDVTKEWVDTLFGANRPLRTTDGAYAFSVVAPYGYQTAMILGHTVTISDISYTTNEEIKEVVLKDIEEAYSGTRSFGKASAEESKETLLDAYEQFLSENSIASFSRGNITQSQEADGTYILTYTAGGDDAAAHQKVLERIAERMSKHLLLNDGYALGTEPKYTAAANGAFISPNLADGPATFTVNATFYNSLVRENRTVIAVLQENSLKPYFNTPIVGKSNNTNDRGTSAKMVYDGDKEYAYTYKYGVKWYDYEKELKYYLDNKWTGNNDRGNEIGNLYTADSWGWNSSPGYGDTESERNHVMYNMGDDTYFFQWTFQTNNSAGGYTLDTLAVNGLSMKLPFLPHYSSPADKYPVAAGPDGMNGYKTTLTLPDGATVSLEFVAQFHENPQQRVYRITVEHAKSDVSITGMNLMQGNGASEVALLELVGVYAPEADGTQKSQSEPAIQIYTTKDQWVRNTTAAIIVNNNDENGGTYYTRPTGKDNQYGANIRFKSIEGYGNPYYLFEATKDGVINEQASATRNPVTDEITDHDNVSYLSDFISSGGTELEPGVVYKDDTNDDGWYYIRLTGQGDYRIGLLTIVARPAKYVLQYMPYVIWQWDNGNIVQVQFDDVDEEGNPTGGTHTVVPVNMPSFPHYDAYGDLLYSDTYDDNNGFYYDTIGNNMAPLPTNSSGIIHPIDPTGSHTFSGWVIADYRREGDPRPQVDEDGNLILYSNRAIEISNLNAYAVLNPNLGADDTDVYVITLVPSWSVVENPFYYDVILYWVDAQGVLHEQGFHDGWNEVLTESPMEGQYIYVNLNKTAGPLLDWIAQNPTYTFWDEVNNATDDNAIENALNKYLRIGLENGGKETSDYEQYDAILQELLRRDRYEPKEGDADLNGDDPTDFDRLGQDHFVVYESHGIISIWMYENKGGLVFHKDVAVEPLEPDDEFYFTVSEVVVNGDAHLNGIYKAYPEAHFYDSKGNKYIADSDGDVIYENNVLISKDEDGNPVLARLINDDDAWIVTFNAGKITQIEKDGEITTYFTLKHGEGIELYVPEGSYTVVEMGSKSGGSYQASITYTATDDSLVDEKEQVHLPDGNTWVSGSDKAVQKEGEPSHQISVTVDFEIGAANVVKILTFHNQTTSISIEKFFDALDENKVYDSDGRIYKIPPWESYENATFTINVSLQLPTVKGEDDTKDELKPLAKTDENGNILYYYFNANFYTVTYREVGSTGTIRETVTPQGQKEVVFTQDESNGRWNTTLLLKAGERVVIVMTAEYEKVNYWVTEESVPVGGYVYKEMVNDDFNNPQYDGYEYFLTLEEAQKAHSGVPVKGGEGYVEGETKAWIEEATLTGMNLTPLITPGQGEAKAGKQAEVEVVNWFGELPGYGYLKITQTGGKSTDSFLFRITGNGVSLIVSVKGGGTTYVYMRCGAYVIEQIDWAWRYEEGHATVTNPTVKPEEGEEVEDPIPVHDPLNIIITIANDSRKNAVHAAYSNDPNNKGWLGVENSTQTSFKPGEETDGD